jgi:hypothetical protein
MPSSDDFQRLFGAIASALILTLLQGFAQAQEKRPNVVVIMTDDTGWGDLSVYGGGKTRNAPTPNLDQLAAEGTAGRRRAENVARALVGTGQRLGPARSSKRRTSSASNRRRSL